MSDIQTKREALDRAIYALSWCEPKNLNEYLHDKYEAAADALEDARELKGHVEACRAGGPAYDCGTDGHYCPKAIKLWGK